MDVQIKQQIKFLRSQYNETLMELDRCKQEQEALKSDLEKLKRESDAKDEAYFRLRNSDG